MTDDIHNALVEACGAIAAIRYLVAKMSDDDITKARGELDRLSQQIAKARAAIVERKVSSD